MTDHKLGLEPMSEQQLLLMTNWFNSEAELRQWAGPNFRFPYSPSSFIQDLDTQKLPSFGLFDQHKNLVGFGQYYHRLDRCHLARLVVNPSYRGKGYSQPLITQLMEIARIDMGFSDVSLFVLAGNQPAIKCYQKLGFKLCEYPGENPLPDCLFMILESSQ